MRHKHCHVHKVIKIAGLNSLAIWRCSTVDRFVAVLTL